MLNENEKHLIPETGLALPMRAEATTRAHASDNWTMAALITTNGAAAIALLAHADRSLATGIALGLYALGIVAALIAGRLSSTLQHETSALFVCLHHMDHASRHLERIAPSASPQQMNAAVALCESAATSWAEQKSDFDKVADPGPWLGGGVTLFLLGCIAAGFALF